MNLGLGLGRMGNGVNGVRQYRTTPTGQRANGSGRAAGTGGCELTLSAESVVGAGADA